jgi:hypothetical protein
LRLISLEYIQRGDVLIWNSDAKPYLFGVSDNYIAFLEKGENITKQHVDFFNLQETIYQNFKTTEITKRFSNF